MGLICLIKDINLPNVKKNHEIQKEHLFSLSLGPLIYYQEKKSMRRLIYLLKWAYEYTVHIKTYITLLSIDL